MDTSNALVNLIRDIIRDETINIDRALICNVVGVHADGTLDITLPSDTNTILNGIPNISAYKFEVGEYAILYKIGNSLNNCFVLSKATRLPPDIYSQNTSYIISGGSSGGGGGTGGNGTTVYVNNAAQDSIYFSQDPQYQLNNLMSKDYDLQTQINGKQNTITGAASTITSNNLSSNIVVITDQNGKIISSNITGAELLSLDGIQGNIQNQIDGKQNKITGAASTITDANLSPNIVAVTNQNGKIISSGITRTELSFLDGLTVNVQGKFNDLDNSVDDLNNSVTELNSCVSDLSVELNDAESNIATLFATKINYTDIVDNHTSSDANAPLSANQGRVIYEKFSQDVMDLNNSVDDLNNSVDDLYATKFDKNDSRYFSYNANGSIGNGTMVMTYDLDNPSEQWINANIGYNNSNISGNGIVFGINNNGSNESVIIGNNWGTGWSSGAINSVIIGDGNNNRDPQYDPLSQNGVFENVILLQPLNNDYPRYISDNSIGIGMDVQTGVGGISIGKNANSGLDGVSIGNSANSSANGTSIGPNSRAGEKSVSIGLNSRTLNSSVAIGDGANAANSSISIGNNVTSDNGVSIGRNVTSLLSGNNAIGIGFDISTNANAISFGREIVSGNESIFIGNNFIENNGARGTIGFGKKISVDSSYFEDDRLFSSILIGENIMASTFDSNNSPIALGKNLDVGDNNIYIGKNISGYGIALGDHIGLNTGYIGSELPSTIAIGTQIGFIHSNGDISIGAYVDSNDRFSISIGKSIIVDGYDQFGRYASSPIYSRGIYIGEHISSNVSSSILIGSCTTSDGVFKIRETIAGGGYRFFPGIAIGEYSSTHNGSISIGTNATGIFPGSVHIYTDYIDDTSGGCDSDHLNYSKSYVAIGGYNASSIIPDHQFDSNLNASFDNLLTVGGVPIVKRWGNDSWQFNNSLMNLATDWQQFPQAANNPMAFSLGIDLYNSVAELNGCVSDLSVELNDAESNIATLFATKINYTDIVDNHTSSDTNAPLSANQGRVIYQAIGNCVSSAIDALPSWSKQPNKPTYNAAEVGAEPAFTKNTAFNKNFGNTPYTVCEGDDPRLYDSRPASDVPLYVKAITQQEVNNWNNTSSLGIEANDVAHWTETYGWYESLNGSVTYENAQNWNNMSNSPAANITDAQINKWDGIYLSPNVSLSEFTFNSNIIPEKVETVLANVSYDISPGPGMPNMIGSLIDTYDIPSANKAYGIFSVDLNAAGGTGYALAVCSVQGYDFYVEQPIYITEYSAQNEGIIQMFPGLSEFTYTSGGWQNTDTYQLPDVAKIYDVYDYKACSFVGNNMTKRFWDIMWMFDPTTVINNTLTQINSGSGV